MIGAIVFDFNGTLSDDEPILYAVYAELFAEHGRPLTEAEYVEHLAGHSEEEIIERWLGHVTDELIASRIDRYIARASDGSSVDEDVRAAVRYAAGRVPTAIVSAAARREIEPVLAAAGLDGSFTTVVASDDVVSCKPDPEAYLLVADRLGVAAADIVAFEDTEAGVASAKAAGMHVVGVTRTMGGARLAQADDLVERIDLAAVRRFLP